MKFLSDRIRAGAVTGRAGRFALCGLACAPLLACSDGGGGSDLPEPVVASVASSDGTATVTWDQIPTALSYDLYWDTDPGIDLQTPNKVTGIVDQSYTITGLANGETYYFAVACTIAGGGTSKLSREWKLTLAPGVVEALTITAGDSMVTLAWEGVYGATSYDLYRDTQPGVTDLTGERIANVSSPFVDVAVTNGTAYYYVIQAIGLGGAGTVSTQVSAVPLEPLGCPENPSVSLVEESPNTLLISWDPPLQGIVDSYNIYWDTSPGVTVGTNPILDVVSPYLHTGLAGRVTYYYVVTAVRGGMESTPSAEVSGTPRGSPGGGHVEGLGNNLSLPLVFADGYGITGQKIDGTVLPYLDHATGLRPTATDVLDPFPYFDPTTIHELNGVDYYEQQSASTWQAGWLDGSKELQVVVADWGDNLQSQTFRENSVVRIETVLYQDDPLDLLDAYGMALLYGQHSTEMQGTDGTVVPTERRHVFTLNARLQIQKLLGPGGAVDPSVQGFDGAVYEGIGLDGPGRYGAEVNVGGKLVFGYVWMLRQSQLTPQQKVGWWRITFSLDPNAVFGDPQVSVLRNVKIDSLDASDPDAGLDPSGFSTWVEIEVGN